MIENYAMRYAAEDAQRPVILTDGEARMLNATEAAMVLLKTALFEADGPDHRGVLSDVICTLESMCKNVTEGY